MSILAHLRRALTSLIPSANLDYSTVVYPTQGIGLMIHDGLGIANEQFWRNSLITTSGLDTYEPGAPGNPGANPQSKSSLGSCGQQLDEESDFFDLYKFCGIGGVFETGIGLFEDDPPWSMGWFGADGSSINPASGLPILDGFSDVAGNPFGSDNF